MPLRRAQPPPDLERVARILAGGSGGSAGSGGSGGSGIGEMAGEGEGEKRQTGWVPVLPPREGGRPGALEQLDADLRRARRPGVVTAPEPMRLGRWSVSSATVVALIALVVAVGCVYVVRVLWAERTSRAGVPATEQRAATGESASAGVLVTGADGATVAARTTDGSGDRAGSTPTAGPEASAGTAEIVVHVVGQVVRPGLVRLRQGARVADAVAAAGGARPGADLSALNLARLVVDGEQLRVPKPGEVVGPSAVGGGSGGGSVGGSGSAGGAAGAGGGRGALVSLNTADLSALDSLPGVGPVLAQRILDWRAEHGRFTSIDELGEVSGIGDKLLTQLRPRVSL